MPKKNQKELRPTLITRNFETAIFFQNINNNNNNISSLKKFLNNRIFQAGGTTTTIALASS
jgi:hypothetical protein